MTEHKGFPELVADAKKKITEISPTDAAAKAKSSDAVIVHVREKDEFDEAHIPDAVHMSRGMVELEVEETISRSQHDNHLSLRWRWPVRPRGRKPAKHGLHK